MISGLKVNKKLGSLLAGQANNIAAALVPVLGLLPRWKPTVELLAGADDVAEFSRRELHVFPAYLALAWLRGDTVFLNLYIGELAKQHYDLSLNGDERAAVIAKKFEAERAVYLDYLSRLGASDCESSFIQVFDSIWSLVIEDSRRRLRVLWISDCLYLDIESFLIAPAAALGITVEPVFVATKNVDQARGEVCSLANDYKFDAVFYSPFSYEYHLPYAQFLYPKKVVRRSFDMDGVTEEAIADTDSMLKVISETVDCPVYIHNSANIIRRQSRFNLLVALLITRGARRKARQRINDWLSSRLKDFDSASFGGFNLVDEMEVVAKLGEMRLGQYIYFDDIHHPAAMGYYLAEKYADIVYVEAVLRTIKLIVCDLDNTLWDGVIGEGAVTHFANRQRILKQLKAKGVILSINSKNDPANVTWKGAVLGMDDFVCPQINWSLKVQNMTTIVEELNLKPKNICFIDDREDEREMVGMSFPDLLLLDATSDDVWRRLDLWSRVVRDAGDIDRTQAYREKSEREAFTKTHDSQLSNDLFASLDLKIEVREALSSDLKRVTELINRTNQFNTTGLRVTFKQIATWSDSTDTRIYVVDAEDKFGRMGIVSAIVVRIIDDIDMIASFVLSCRVFGYGIETAVLERVRADCRTQAVSARIIETQANGPCRQVYKDHGFILEDGFWVLRNSSPLEMKPWLTVVSK